MNLDLKELEKYMPWFIAIGIIVLVGTFLGPIGIVVVIIAIGALIYQVFKAIKDSIK